MYNSNLETIITKLESVPGVAETMLSADRDVSIVAGSIQFDTLPDIDGAGKNSIRLKYGERKGIPGTKSGRISFTVKFRYSGTNTTPPKIAKLLKSCAAQQDVIAAGVTYTPLSTKDITTITIEYYMRKIATVASPNDYKKWILSGCMGNCVVSADGTGRTILMAFTFSGKLSEPVEVTSIVAEDVANIETSLPEKWLNSTFNYNLGTQLKVDSWSLDFGNTVQPEYLQSETSGIAYYRVKQNRDPRFTTSHYTVSVANEPVYTYYSDVEEIEAFARIPTTSPHLEIYLPRTQMISNSFGSRQGKIVEEITYQLNANEGQDATIDDEACWQLVHGEK